MTDGVSDDVINIDNVTGVRQCLDECSNLKRSGNISLSGIDAVTTHEYRQAQPVCRCLIGFKQFVWTKYHSLFFSGQLLFFIVYLFIVAFFFLSLSFYRYFS